MTPAGVRKSWAIAIVVVALLASRREPEEACKVPMMVWCERTGFFQAGASSCAPVPLGSRHLLDAGGGLIPGTIRGSLAGRLLFSQIRRNFLQTLFGFSLFWSFYQEDFLSPATAAPVSCR